MEKKNRGVAKSHPEIATKKNEGTGRKGEGHNMPRSSLSYVALENKHNAFEKEPEKRLFSN